MICLISPTTASIGASATGLSHQEDAYLSGDPASAVLIALLKLCRRGLAGLVVVCHSVCVYGADARLFDLSQASADRRCVHARGAVHLAPRHRHHGGFGRAVAAELLVFSMFLFTSLSFAKRQTEIQRSAAKETVVKSAAAAMSEPTRVRLLDGHRHRNGRYHHHGSLHHE